MQEHILKLNNLSKHYPGVVALDDVSMEIRRGETHALVGANGAGKSTLIKIISGETTPSAGTIEYEGQAYSAMSPMLSLSLGISVMYQELNIMEGLSVAENIFAGCYPTKNGLYDAKETTNKAREIFKEIGIDIDVKAQAGSYSVGHMQMIEMAKALVRDIKLLILDEPTAPLTDNETRMLFRIMKVLKDKGVTIIYISHRLEEIFGLADSVTILRDGKKKITADIDAITKAEMIRSMVGKDVLDIYPPRKGKVGDEVVLKAENLCGNGVENISFDLHRGEILGFGGLVGAGRTEIMRVLFGADKKDSGSVLLYGNTIHIVTPEQSVKNNLAFLPEDRKRDGALLGLTIAENIVLPSLKRISRFGLMNRKKEIDMAAKQISDLSIACYSNQQEAGKLSGGNQQKVVLAKWLASGAQILIFDEPTRGIDVGAKWEIYLLMRDLCEQGKSIIMISSEIEELIGMSDRILVLYEGKQQGLLDESAMTQEHVMILASGEALEERWHENENT